MMRINSHKKSRSKNTDITQIVHQYFKENTIKKIMFNNIWSISYCVITEDSYNNI